MCLHITISLDRYEAKRKEAIDGFLFLFKFGEGEGCVRGSFERKKRLLVNHHELVRSTVLRQVHEVSQIILYINAFFII